MSFSKSVYTLSTYSNLLFDVDKGTAKEQAQQLAEEIPKEIQKSGPADYQIVWGPVVFKAQDGPTGGPDLVAYVAKKAKFHIVAIADVHAHSDRAKNFYNVRIEQFVDWAVWLDKPDGILTDPTPLQITLTPQRVYLAYGTAQGICDLARTTAKVGPSQGTTILQYLKTIEKGSKLVFTGHGLGGALAAALAWGLLNQLTNLSKNDIMTFPTGAPSIGNAAFVEFWQFAFTKKAEFNTNFINTNDPVPMAWSLDTNKSAQRCLLFLFKVFGKIEKSKLPERTKLMAQLCHLSSIAKVSGMIYTFLPTTTFTGREVPFKPPTNDKELCEDFWTAHVYDYNVKFDLPEKLRATTTAYPVPTCEQDYIRSVDAFFNSEGNFIFNQ